MLLFTAKTTTKNNKNRKTKKIDVTSPTATTNNVDSATSTAWESHHDISIGKDISFYLLSFFTTKVTYLLPTMLFFSPNGNIPLLEAAVSDTTQVTTSTEPSVPTTLTQGIPFH